MLVYKKPIPVYFGDLVIVVNDNFTESFKRLGLSFPIGSGVAGMAYHVQNKITGHDRFIILLSTNPRHGTIAHEALHITHYILKEAQHSGDHENDEPECYLHGYIVKEIYKFLDKNNIIVKI